MAGGWSGGLHLANAKDAGSDSTTSTGAWLTSGGSAFTVGGWTELIAATTNDTAWVMVHANVNSSSGSFLAFDIAVGASGNETAVASKLVSNQVGGSGTIYMFPLTIPAGTRIASRFSSDFSTDTANINLTLFDDVAGSAHAGGIVDTYGFSSSSNNGVAVDPGSTTNTKGAYAQISASLTYDIAGFFMGFDGRNKTAGTAGRVKMLMDVAVGASGSEKVILPNFVRMNDYGSGWGLHYPDASPYIPVPIKAGTRVAVRAQADQNTSPDRIFGVTFYGVRQ